MRIFLAIVLLVPLAGCGSHPTAPKPPVVEPPEVITSYAGTWSGTYQITSCTNTGFYADQSFCTQVLGTTVPVTFMFTQEVRAVSGSFQLGSLSFSGVSAAVASDSSLTFSAEITSGVFPIDAAWILRQPATGTLKGSTHQVWRVAGQSGQAVLDGEIVNVGKS